MSASLIESPSDALDTIKELFKRGATFGCQKLDKGWVVVIFYEGRGYGDDSAGSPVEMVNQELLGRVLAARHAQSTGENL